MVDTSVAADFLAQHRIAVVGASDDPKSFGRTLLVALRDHGHDVVAVHPSATTVAGAPAYAELAAIPGTVDGALVVVGRERALGVVDACITLGIPRVWLFKGIGGAGASSPEAVRRCTANDIAVVDGACPLMFLEPVRGVHRFHRALRHLNGSLRRIEVAAA